MKGNKMHTNHQTAIPTELVLACGHCISHEIGRHAYNHYDMVPVTITKLAERPEPDASGLLPDGEAWWVETTGGYLDGSRMICNLCADMLGWG